MQSIYTLIPKQRYRPRACLGIHLAPTLMLVKEMFTAVPEGEQLAIDIETTGLDATGDEIVGFGVAYSQGYFYLDARVPEIQQAILYEIACRKYYAFNTSFDASFIVYQTKQQLWPEIEYHKLCENIAGDAMVLFRMLANEGFWGQRWNLEAAIENILGWQQHNKDWLKQKLSKHGIGKNEMWRLADLEPKGFGRYCGLDAEAAWQLMTYLKEVCNARKFPRVVEFHDKLWANSIQLAVEQHLRGILIDILKMLKLELYLKQRLEEKYHEFINHPDVAKHIARYNAWVEDTKFSYKTSERKMWAKFSEKPWEASQSEGWIRGHKKTLSKWEQEHGAWFRYAPSKTKTELTPFNINSPDNLRWLYYQNDIIDYKVTRPPDPQNEKPWLRIGLIEVILPDGNIIEWEMTKAGALPTDKGIRTFFGDSGKILNQYSKLETYLGYVECLKRVTKPLNEHYGIWHPDTRIHGTVSGRNSGGSEDNIKKVDKLSWQIVPKIKEFCECFIARPGHTLVGVDWASVEDVLMAEFSEDATFNEIYGSDKPHDGYLMVAIQGDPKGEEIAELYCPDNPTKQSVGAAKKKYKAIRQIWKQIKLAKNYGGGAQKIRRSLAENSIFMSLEEVKQITDDYDESTKGIIEYKARLKKEWESNGGRDRRSGQKDGWVRSPLGVPIGCAWDVEKDVANRVIQHCGHVATLILAYYTNKIRKKNNIAMYPFNYDLHDEEIYEIRTENMKQAVEVETQAVGLVNQFLNHRIPLKGVPDIGVTLDDFKETQELYK